MATLVGRPQAQDFMVNTHEGALSSAHRIQVVQGTQTSAQLPGIDLGHANGVGAWRHRQGTVGKSLFDGIDIVPVAASPSSTVEVTNNEVHYRHIGRSGKPQVQLVPTVLARPVVQ